MSETGFLLYKSEHVTRWTLLNLPTLHEWPHVSAAGRPFLDRTVFVVGAGPSLANNVDDLRDAKARGGIVVCVNAAAGPLEQARVPVDVMVLRESLDLTDQIEQSTATLIAADLSTHPDNWPAAGDRLAWFIPDYPRHAELAYHLGVSTLRGGPSALCSAVALSLQWGARTVALVGCDLALTSDGRVYHPDAPRGALSYQRVGEGESERVTFRGDEQDRERCKRSGQEPPPETVRFAEVMSQDWSEVLPTLSVYQDQREWLSTQADRHGGVVTLLNATEGGAGVPGWRSVQLVDVPVMAGPPPSLSLEPNVSEATVKHVCRRVVAGAATQEQISREMLSPGGPDPSLLAKIPGAAFGSPLAEALAAKRIATQVKGSPREQLTSTYEIMRDAAAEAQTLITGTSVPQVFRGGCGSGDSGGTYANIAATGEPVGRLSVCLSGVGK